MDGLGNALEVFIDVAKKGIAKKTTRKKSSPDVYFLITNKHLELNHLVNKVLEDPSYLRLVAAASDEFSEIYKNICHPYVSGAFIDHIHKLHGDIAYESDFLNYYYAMKNFFCRSGFFHDIYNGNKISSDQLYKQFLKSFSRTETKITILVPLIGISFSTRSFQLDDCEIRRYTASELSKVLAAEIIHTFYPEYNLDVNKLKNYWYLILKDKIRTNYDDDDTEKEDTTSAYYYGSDLPGRITEKFKILSLYSARDDFRVTSREIERIGKIVTSTPQHIWQYIDKPPYVLQTNDALIDLPWGFKVLRTFPGLPTLEQDPYAVSSFSKMVMPGRMSSAEVEGFKKFIAEKSNVTEYIKRNKSDWDFLDISLSYFKRAFFSHRDDQILWHITAIEALIGEKNGVLDNVSRRMAMILGGNAEERMDIQKKFKKIYNIRSEIVHGEKYSDEILESYMDDARRMARALVLWFLHFASYLIDKSQTSEKLASVNRRYMLKLIDLGGSSDLPSDFPHIKEWLR